MKMEYTVRLSVEDKRKYFVFHDWDDVQNFIGYMAHGNGIIELSIITKEEADHE